MAALPPQPLTDLAFYVESMQEDISGDLYVQQWRVGETTRPPRNSVLTASFIISCIMTYWFIRLLFMGAQRVQCAQHYHTTCFQVLGWCGRLSFSHQKTTQRGGATE